MTCLTRTSARGSDEVLHQNVVGTFAFAPQPSNGGEFERNFNRPLELPHISRPRLTRSPTQSAFVDCHVDFTRRCAGANKRLRQNRNCTTSLPKRADPHGLYGRQPVVKVFAH